MKTVTEMARDAGFSDSYIAKNQFKLSALIKIAVNDYLNQVAGNFTDATEKAEPLKLHRAGSFGE